MAAVHAYGVKYFYIQFKKKKCQNKPIRARIIHQTKVNKIIKYKKKKNILCY